MVNAARELLKTTIGDYSVSHHSEIILGSHRLAPLPPLELDRGGASLLGSVHQSRLESLSGHFGSDAGVVDVGQTSGSPEGSHRDLWRRFIKLSERSRRSVMRWSSAKPS